MAESARGSKNITASSSAPEPKKAIDRPIGQPDPAREEAPIGWDFGPEGEAPFVKPDIHDGAGNAARDADDFSQTSAIWPGTDERIGGEATTDERSGPDALPAGGNRFDAVNDRSSQTGMADHVPGGSSGSALAPGVAISLQPHQSPSVAPDIHHAFVAAVAEQRPSGWE